MPEDPGIADRESSCSLTGLSSFSARVGGGTASPVGLLNLDVEGCGPSGSVPAWECGGRRLEMVAEESRGGSTPWFAASGVAWSGFSFDRSDAPVMVPGVTCWAS